MLQYLYFLDTDPIYKGGHVTTHRSSPLHRSSERSYPTMCSIGCKPDEGAARGVPLYTLHATRHALHPAPFTLHPTPYTLHPTPYTLHPTPCTLRAWQRRCSTGFEPAAGANGVIVLKSRPIRPIMLTSRTISGCYADILSNKWLDRFRA